jgi:hypothetical protein
VNDAAAGDDDDDDGEYIGCYHWIVSTRCELLVEHNIDINFLNV